MVAIILPIPRVEPQPTGNPIRQQRGVREWWMLTGSGGLFLELGAPVHNLAWTLKVAVDSKKSTSGG